MVRPLMSFEDVGTKRAGIHAGGMPQKYVLDERGRRLILGMYDGTSERISDLERMLGVPRWVVRKWGRELGLARTKEPFWTQEEEEYVEHNLHRKSLADIAKHLGRTKTAVKLKAKRLGVNKTQEGYTMRGLCMGLGCDHKKVEYWMRIGWLKGKRRGSERVAGQGGDMWLFTDRDIRKFVISHPNEVDQRRCDFLWLVDLLAGGNDYGGISALSSPTQKRGVAKEEVS